MLGDVLNNGQFATANFTRAVFFAAYETSVHTATIYAIIQRQNAYSIEKFCPDLLLSKKRRMIEKLDPVVADIGDLNCKLALVAGPSRIGKTRLLRCSGARLNIEPLNVGLKVGRRLAAMPRNNRSYSSAELLREIAGKGRVEYLLPLDNLEVLFDPGLQINPLTLSGGWLTPCAL